MGEKEVGMVEGWKGCVVLVGEGVKLPEGGALITYAKKCLIFFKFSDWLFSHLIMTFRGSGFRRLVANVAKLSYNGRRA